MFNAILYGWFVCEQRNKGEWREMSTMADCMWCIERRWSSIARFALNNWSRDSP